MALTMAPPAMPHKKANGQAAGIKGSRKGKKGSAQHDSLHAHVKDSRLLGYGLPQSGVNQRHSYSYGRRQKGRHKPMVMICSNMVFLLLSLPVKQLPAQNQQQ